MQNVETCNKSITNQQHNNDVSSITYFQKINNTTIPPEPMVQEPTCPPVAAEQPPAPEPMVQEPLRPLLAAEQQLQPKDIMIPASKKKKQPKDIIIPASKKKKKTLKKLRTVRNY